MSFQIIQVIFQGAQHTVATKIIFHKDQLAESTKLIVLIEFLDSLETTEGTGYSPVH